MIMDENTYLCALNRIFGFEPKIGLALLSHLGSAKAVFKLTEQEKNEILGAFSKYRHMLSEEAVEKSAKELNKIKKDGINFCGYAQEGYPKKLMECEDAPLGLYVRGNLPKEMKNAIAIVGSRNLTIYGQECCKDIVRAISECKESPIIISGLALGTDIVAHKTARECGLGTIGVMATGPDKIYPSRHNHFAKNLIKQDNCALVTDYPPGTEALPIHFIRRNRIIAGMSDSTILIESKIKGGGMITARLAFSYNRDVFALPGRINDPMSQGCNYLIRNEIAAPITDYNELIKSLNLKKDNTRKLSELNINQLYNGILTQDKIKKISQILSIIKVNPGTTFRELEENMHLNSSEVRELTCILEADNIIDIDILQRCTIKVR